MFDQLSKRRFLLAVMGALMSLNMNAQNVITELQEYFYPKGEHSYVRTPNSGEHNMISTYEIYRGNTLNEILTAKSGASLMKMKEMHSKFMIDENRKAVISTFQIHQNPLTGVNRTTNHITLFILPEDKVVNWKETENGEISNCSAKFVYVSFVCNGKKVYHQAVRIEKAIPLSSSKFVKNWSYWVKGFGRLATYGYWGNPDEVSCIEKSVSISLDDPVVEISEKEYNSMR